MNNGAPRQHWCAACGGTGEVYEVRVTRDGPAVDSAECQVCNGAGDMDQTACVAKTTTVMVHEWLATGTVSHVCRRCNRSAVSIRARALEELM